MRRLKVGDALNYVFYENLSPGLVVALHISRYAEAKRLSFLLLLLARVEVGGRQT